MDQVKVCRVCLNTDVKMYDLRRHPLDHYVKTIELVETLSSTDLPPYACFECAAMIKKIYFFTEKCMRGQTALCDVLNTMGTVTEFNIKNINRHSLNLASHLSCHNICADNIINVKHENPEILLVKLEVCEESARDDDPKYDMDMDVETDVKDEASDVSSNDSKRKRKSKSNTRKKKPERAKLKVKKGIKFKVSKPDQLEEPPPPPKPKRSRKKPEIRKGLAKIATGGVDDDGNLDESVNIIVLSKEEQLKEIEKRKTSPNYIRSAFKCELCYKGFLDDAAWQHHRSRHDPNIGDLECEICKFRFSNKRQLSNHAIIHTKRYACKACPYVSTARSQAKLHHQWHKGVTYQCQHCGEVSSTASAYLGHLRLKHPSEFVCGECGCSFVSQRGLALHKSMMHKDALEKEASKDGESEDGPSCARCDVKFASLRAYRRHMVTSAKHKHNKEFQNGCRVCGETFPTEEELRVHHRSHAPKLPIDYNKRVRPQAGFPRVCALCPEVVERARAYWTHFRRAHPGQRYPMQWNHVCDVCGKTFQRNALLQYHKRTHSMDRPFKCTQCPKAFFNRTNLIQHEKSHSDTRPFACSLCLKGFKFKGALERHFRSHTGEKPKNIKPKKPSKPTREGGSGLLVSAADPMPEGADVFWRQRTD